MNKLYEDYDEDKEDVVNFFSNSFLQLVTS